MTLSYSLEIILMTTDSSNGSTNKTLEKNLHQTFFSNKFKPT